MTALDRLPPAAAIAIAVLVVAGATLALLGSLGLVRMKSFYQRLHAPPLAASGGVILIALASMLLFSLLEGRAILHEAVIVLFMLVVTPVSMAVLGRAALRRDRDRKLGHDEAVPPRGNAAPDGTARDAPGTEAAPDRNPD